MRTAYVKDEVGQRFGRLVVKARRPNVGAGVRWLCRCDCGKMIVTRGSSLRKGTSASCGCVNAGRLGNFKRLPHGESSRRKVLYVAKDSARKRDYSWSLTDEQAFEIFARNCHYCDLPPSNVSHHKQSNGGFTYSGIDRVDNDRGYETDNVVACCIHCNVAKRTRSRSEFLAWIARVYVHSKCWKGE